MRVGPTAREVDRRLSAQLSADGRVLRAIAANQLLWTAGYSLTTGGFLLYFARELGANAAWIAVLLVLPESAGIAGLLTRSVARNIAARKRLFVTATIAARLVALPIPLLALLTPTSDAGGEFLWIVAACVVATHAIGAIAYTAYLSWLSDLMPDVAWGRMFAHREISKLAILLVLPVGVGYLRDVWTSIPELTFVGYGLTFVAGQVLLTTSILPMLGLPSITPASRSSPRTDWQQVRAAFQNRSMRSLLAHNWSLAFANGLTQSAFFLFSASFGPLGISLGTYNLMSGLMRGLQIPVSMYAGRVCDRNRALAARVWGVFIGSSGLVFWLIAQRETWWLLFLAYAMWGAYAAANVAGDKLMLEFAPRSDNATHIALFVQVGGLLSGLAGLLGGIWLDHLREVAFGRTFAMPWGAYRFESYQLVFAVSLAARYGSLAWLWPIAKRRRDEAIGSLWDDCTKSVGGGA